MGQSASVARSALAKTSWRIIPLLGARLSLFCYLDRLNVSFAATQMNVDLKFSATVYGFGSGFFFLTYALLEIPSGMMMPRIGARRWIVRIMISWGADLRRHDVRPNAHRVLCHAAASRSRRGGLLADLHILSVELVSGGASRAGDQPLLLLRRGYRHRRRDGVEPGCSVSTGSAPCAAGSGCSCSKVCRRLRSACAMFWLLPDAPATAAWLSDDERRWVVGELAAENARLAAGQAAARASRAAAIPWCFSSRRSACLTIGGYIGLCADRAAGPDDRHRYGCPPRRLSHQLRRRDDRASECSRPAGTATGSAAGSAICSSAPCWSPPASPRWDMASTPAMTDHGLPRQCRFFWPAVTLSTNLVATEVVPCRMVAVAVAVHQHAGAARRVRRPGPVGHQQGFHRLLSLRADAVATALPRQRRDHSEPAPPGPSQAHGSDARRAAAAAIELARLNRPHPRNRPGSARTP